jgi:hypothetical protein
MTPDDGRLVVSERTLTRARQHHMARFQVQSTGEVRVAIAWLDPIMDDDSLMPMFADLDLFVKTPAGDVLYGNGGVERFITTERIVIPNAAVGDYEIHVLAEVQDNGDTEVGFATVVSGKIGDGLEFSRETNDCTRSCAPGGVCNAGVCQCTDEHYVGHFCEIERKVWEQSDFHDDVVIQPLQSIYLRFKKPTTVAGANNTISVTADFKGAGPNWPLRIFYKEAPVERGIPFEYSNVLRGNANIGTGADILELMVRNDMLFEANVDVENSVTCPLELSQVRQIKVNDECARWPLPSATPEAPEEFWTTQMLALVIGCSAGGVIIIIVIVVIVCCVCRRKKDPSNGEEDVEEEPGNKV